ncbi:MAG: chlorophyll synthesis pathway protein BchC [Hyphomicrobiaceae bacterium]|nr:chlorophyll synthesis pathway protein BchC [Hyphomicrobiaceae bacterium]
MVRSSYDTVAVVLERPEHVALSRMSLPDPEDDDVVVDIEWSGVSTGTERLLWSGRMPTFPGMGYPLVPGYESVGRISAAGRNATARIGERVFVPGARCFGEVKALFGGSASRVVVPAARVTTFDDALGERGVLFALAATAYHAIAAEGARAPDLVVGHGVLGRLIARITMAIGAPPPVVWETEPLRRGDGYGYPVVHPDADTGKSYRSICDVSGNHELLDTLIARLAPQGEVVLAGFYHQRLSFAFPSAFMREARLRVAAEWRQPDLESVCELVRSGRLSLDGLITNSADARTAGVAYETAFNDPTCLKLVLDWSDVS